LITYKPDIVGDFQIFPIEERLQLKLGAQVMFVKNDLSFEKLFQRKNGNYKIPFEPGNSGSFSGRQNIEVEKYEWQNIRYKIDPATKEIEEVLGTLYIIL
jgi:hypothetical protein